MASIFCEIIYILTILIIGRALGGKIYLPMMEFIMFILNSLLVIITYCSIYNSITMICPEITVATVISIITFIIMFIVEASVGYIANQPKYTTNSYYEDGKEYIISQEINPNYPGDEKVKIAKTIYLIIPQGQASKIANMDTEVIYKMPIYSLIIISIINIGGIYLFSKKELK